MDICIHLASYGWHSLNRQCAEVKHGRSDTVFQYLQTLLLRSGFQFPKQLNPQVFRLLAVPSFFRNWGHYSREVDGHENAHQVFVPYMRFEHLIPAFS